MASRKPGLLVAVLVVGVCPQALAQGTSGSASGTGGTGSSAGTAAGPTGAYGAGANGGGAFGPAAYGAGAYGAGSYGPYSTSFIGAAGNPFIGKNVNSGTTSSTATTSNSATTSSSGSTVTPRRFTNFFTPAAPSLGPSATAAGQKSSAINGSNTAPQAAAAPSAVSAPGVGVGHAANGLPIGTTGSGLGSPEQPIGSGSR